MRNINSAIINSPTNCRREKIGKVNWSLYYTITTQLLSARKHSNY